MRNTIKGPIRDQVRGNIRRLREGNRLSLAELSRRLHDLGHPLGTTAIHKIEQGDRKPDVDDLVAFALALHVAPNVLLLPSSGDAAPLTANVTMAFGDAWRWARDGVANPEHIDTWTLGEWESWEGAHPDQPGALMMQFSPEKREQEEALNQALRRRVEELRGPGTPMA